MQKIVINSTVDFIFEDKKYCWQFLFNFFGSKWQNISKFSLFHQIARNKLLKFNLIKITGITRQKTTNTIFVNYKLS